MTTIDHDVRGYCASLDDQLFAGEYESREAALAAMTERAREAGASGVVTIWTARGSREAELLGVIRAQGPARLFDLLAEHVGDGSGPTWMREGVADGPEATLGFLLSNAWEIWLAEHPDYQSEPTEIEEHKVDLDAEPA
jgi:hypothetical protein